MFGRGAVTVLFDGVLEFYHWLDLVVLSYTGSSSGLSAFRQVIDIVTEIIHYLDEFWCFVVLQNVLLRRPLSPCMLSHILRQR